MLAQTTLASIAGILKVTPEALKTAIEAKEEVGIKTKVDDKEVDVDASKITGFTAEELTTRDNSIKETAKNVNITVGKELMIKELKEKIGIDIAGKDPEKFIEAAKEKILKDAKIAPDQKVAELEAQLKTIREGSGASDVKIKELENQLDTTRLDMQLMTAMPARNADISDEDYLILLKSRLKSEKNADGTTIFKDAAGNILQDKLAKPLDIKSAVASIFEKQTAWQPAKDAKGGRGGGNSGAGGAGGGAKPTSYSEAKKEWEDAGKSINGADFVQYLGTLKTADKDFKMDIGEPASTT